MSLAFPSHISCRRCHAFAPPTHAGRGARHPADSGPGSGPPGRPERGHGRSCGPPGHSASDGSIPVPPERKYILLTL